MESIEQVVRKYGEPSAALDALIAELVAREDAMADTLRLVAVQFGLHPEIVAEVLTNGIHMGSPVTEEQALHVRRQYAACIVRIQQEQQRKRDEQ
jgi:hypothetical protein